MVVAVVATEDIPEFLRGSFEGRLTELFQGESGRVIIKHPDSAQRRELRNFETMNANGAEGAARALANRTRADIVVLLSLEGDGRDIQARYVIYDENRGQRMGGYPWKMKLKEESWNHYEVSRFCRAMYGRMHRDMSRFGNVAMEVVVHVVDMDDRLERPLRDELEKLRDVVERVDFDQGRAEGENTTAFAVRYGGRSPLDLREDARDILASLMNVDTGRIKADTTGRSDIILRVLPVAAAAAPGTGSLDLSIFDRFGKAYHDDGDPKIALLIDRKVRDAAELRGARERIRKTTRTEKDDSVEKTESELQGDAFNGKQTIRSGEDNIYTRGDLLRSEELETRISRRFTDLGVEVREVRAEIQDIVKEYDFQIGAVDDYRQALNHLNQDVADIVIFGIGEEVMTSSGLEIRYSFKAYTTRSNRQIAHANVEQTVARSESVNWNDQQTRARDQLAEDAVFELATNLVKHWSKPGRVLVEVQGCKSQRSVTQLRNWIERTLGKHIERVISGSFKAGLGSFEVVYVSRRPAFMGALDRALEDPEAPVKVSIVESGREKYRVKVESDE